MTDHPNFTRTQAALDAMERGEYEPIFDLFADDIIHDNGPGAGPWRRAVGKEDLALMLMEFAAFFGDSFRQSGRCLFADDRLCVSLIHETGTAPSGDRYDNTGVYVSRLAPDGRADRMGSFDLDVEQCEAFWRKNPGEPSKDFS